MNQWMIARLEQGKRAKQALVAGVLTGVSMIAAATPTDPFDAAVADATTRVTSYGGALVTFSAVAVLFWIAIKYVKKIPRAS